MAKFVVNKYVFDGDHSYRFIRKHSGRQLDIRVTMTEEEHNDRNVRLGVLLNVRKEIQAHREAQ